MIRNTALILVSYSGHTNIVSLFLSSGAAVDDKANDGNSALIWASSEG